MTHFVKNQSSFGACRLAVVLSTVGCRWRSVRQSFCNPLTPAILQAAFGQWMVTPTGQLAGSLTSGVKSMDEFVTLFMFMPKSDSLHSTDSMQLFVPCSRIRTLILGYSSLNLPIASGKNKILRSEYTLTSPYHDDKHSYHEY